MRCVNVTIYSTVACLASRRGSVPETELTQWTLRYANLERRERISCRSRYKLTMWSVQAVQCIVCKSFYSALHSAGHRCGKRKEHRGRRYVEEGRRLCIAAPCLPEENGARMGFKLSCISDNNARGKGRKGEENRSYIYTQLNTEVYDLHLTYS